MAAHMKIHLSFDRTTGSTKAVGKSGRWYSQPEIDRAYAARRGVTDPEGAAIADDLDHGDLSDEQLHQAFLDEIHDCPDCRAAMAAGETPHVQLVRPARKRFQRTRWRDHKRRVRRNHK
jgi:hypothetical protein